MRMASVQIVPVKVAKPKLTAEGKERFPALYKFAKNLIASEDIDPLYPVLKHLQKDLDPEQKLWHSFLYVAWYNLPSATAAFTEYSLPNKQLLKHIDPKWPTGIERRNNRGGKVVGHIDSYLKIIEVTKSQKKWYWEGLSRDKEPEDNWRILNERIQTLHGNGRWAAYKFCEVLRKVNNLPIQAPDMGHQFSSGPREGLAMLFGEIPGQTSEVIDQLNAQGDVLIEKLQKLGLDVGQEEVETVLCNFKSLMKGKYYTGHDIDELQEQIVSSLEKKIITIGQAEMIFEARRAVLPKHYLGERGNPSWVGVQKRRQVAYRETGKIVIRKP